MEFRKYQHVERFGTTEVNGIELGKCWIFYKIDGTNASVWLGDDGNVHAGSRKRELSLEKDNAGFYAYAIADPNIKAYLDKHPTHRLYGEWLVPHSLKTYRDDAWKKFYVFDVCTDKDDDTVEYIPYDVYKPLLEEFNLEYIPPIAVITNPSYEQLINLLEQNTFLIQDGKGNGEGIVIKNYDFVNRYGRTTWAKIVTSEFKEKHYKTMGAPEIKGKDLIEEKIIDEYCTKAFIDKEFAKIVTERGEWQNKMIPMLFGRTYHELIQEEIWNIVKQYKQPTINFKTLHSLLVNKIKDMKPELFS